MNVSSGSEGRRDEAPADRPRRDWRALALRLVAPSLILAAALVLPSYMLNTDRVIRGTGPGPTAWPNVMLALIAICAAIWMVEEFLAWRRPNQHDALTPGGAMPTEEVEHYAYPKAVIGLALILAYGVSLPIIGFTIATLLFIGIWCVVGGIRNPLVVLPVALIGTVALLWLFMGLALMPLSRGGGVFDQISIAILQMLGIY